MKSPKRHKPAIGKNPNLFIREIGLSPFYKYNSELTGHVADRTDKSVRYVL
ncbi:MAG: hypothetical protein M3209_13830 [Acidobacteriota bacterium]|nr:hypothetical protein [Acidobacteriota bacterium]